MIQTTDIIEVQIPAEMAIKALIHMVNLCPNNYRIWYQRERVVRIDHTGGEFSAISEESISAGWYIDDPAEFASFCNNLVVERLTGREGTNLLHMEAIPIEVWLTVGSVE